MATTFERKVEQVIMDLISARPELPAGFEVVHFDEAERAAVDRVIVQAITKAREGGGPKPHVLEVEASVRMSAGSVAELEDVFRAIESAIYEEPETIPDSIEPFEVFITPDGGENDRDNDKRARKRSRTFQVIAKEKP